MHHRDRSEGRVVTLRWVHSREQAGHATTAGWGGQVRRGAEVHLDKGSRHRCLPLDYQAAGERTDLDGALVDVRDAPAQGLCSCSCCAGRSVGREQRRRDGKRRGATVEGELQVGQWAQRGLEELELPRGDASAGDGRVEVEKPSLRAGSRLRCSPSCRPLRSRLQCTPPRPR